jgi:hypothetical protein
MMIVWVSMVLWNMRVTAAADFLLRIEARNRSQNRVRIHSWLSVSEILIMM